MKYVLTLLFSLPLLLNAQDWQTLTFDANVPGLEINPDKGLVPGFDGVRNFPYSMEFFYLGLNSTMTGPGTYDWTAFEAKLEQIADEGNRAIPRFMMDYPTELPATPQYLIDAGLQMNSYTEYGNVLSLSPDYSDEMLMTELEAFIAAYGALYDGDPRIACVQAGTIGFWGEWHNYPLDASLGISEANRLRIFEAYVNAFPNTQISVREPKSGIPTALLGQVGYNDDSFALSTLGPEAWHHWPKMIAFGIENSWMDNMQGGEIHPSLQGDIWTAIPNNVGQDWTTCVETSHATYMLNHGIFDDAVGSVTHANALIGSAQLGYQFYVNAVRINSADTEGMNVDIRVQNDGVAPFYYDWNIALGLVDANGLVTQLATQDLLLSNLMPETEAIWNFPLTQSIPEGDYQLVMSVINPLAALKPNAKSMHFANASQDEHVDGWLSLAGLSIVNSCPADIDANGQVDIDDFLILNSEFGTNCAGCAADINNDGSVDIDDFLLVNSAFGEICQ